MLDVNKCYPCVVFNSWSLHQLIKIDFAVVVTAVWSPHQLIEIDFAVVVAAI